MKNKQKEEITWIYVTGEGGSAFGGRQELRTLADFPQELRTLADFPQELRPLGQFLLANPHISDLSWQTDDGIDHLIKRKKDGQVSAPR